MTVENRIPENFPESQVPYTMEELIKQFRLLKADAEALAKEQAEAMWPYTSAMDIIKNFVLLKLDEQKEKSVSTHAGTAYISTGLKPKVDNRDALLEHVRNIIEGQIALYELEPTGPPIADEVWKEAFSILDIGILLEPLKDYLDKSGGEPPPGVTIEYWRRCNIRK